MEYIDKVLGIKFHRNGVGGAPFKVVFFTEKEEGRTLIATVFATEHHTAVIDPLDPQACWRGDRFESDLRQVIEKDERDQFGDTDFFEAITVCIAGNPTIGVRPCGDPLCICSPAGVCEWVATGTGKRCTNDATDVSLYHALCAKHAAGAKVGA